LAIMSYYTAGLKVVDITNPESPVEIGGYDTYPSSNAGSYAGAWSTFPFFPSKRIIIGDMQSGLYVVDIKPTIPKSPTQLQGFSDFSTPTSIQLTWQDPHQTILDDTLNNYNLQLYRNAGLIAQVDSGVQSFLDSGLVNHQYYTYTLRAKNLSTGDLSAPIQISDYAGGHPQPKSPTLFGSRDASDGAELSWKNPSEQIDETPLNDLAYILIYRDGFLYDSISQNSLDTSQIRSYFDSTSGYHTYRIRARDNETPTNFSTYTDSLLGYGGVLTSYSESFEGGRGSIFKTGLWDTTRWLASDGAVSLTDSRGVQYTNNSNTYFLTPSILVGNHPANAGLQFSHIVITYPGDWAILEISNDQRLTFTELKRYSWLSHTGWEDGTAEQSDWFTDRFDLTSYDGDTVTFRFRLQTNPAIIADGWYIDNIKVGTGDTVTTTSTVVDNSWNLVSLPLIVPDGRTSTLFPTATSSAFAYEGGYAAKDTLQHGNGYWLKFDSTMTIDLTGVPLRKDTIDVNARWNLIGSLSYSFNASTVKSIPTGIITTSFYTFNGSYAPSFIIDPGKAYWVKTSQAGKIIFSSFSNLIAPSSPPQKKTIFEKLNTLLFTDRDGNLQTLYFGANIQEPMPLEQFELPPLPPRGTFDIRFSSQRNVEIAEKTSEKEFQIHAYSAQYPITVAWSIVDGDKSRWILFDDSTQITLERRGQFTFNELKNLSLRALNTHETRNPTSFKLKQNYPNPFNPTTVIQYAVTSTQFVSLKVFNVLGQELATLVNEEKHAGFYHVTFDASNLLSGVYYYRLTAGKFTDVKKILLLK
ncbi:MAG TPA: T9SS type A sorting domain-containing protein, partial [Bacteroidota bacterium]|nr:T9SS type A sorting domain-containing protein [Bacteroidota bacterium]